MATFYAWPLPGEGVTAEELLMAEIRAALPGVNTYSGAARRDAILAEIVRAVFNGQSLTSVVAALATITDLRPTRVGLTQSVLTSIGNAAVTPDVSAGSYIQVNVNTAGAYTINNPTSAYNVAALAQPVWVEVHNGSGGAITTTWAANWHLAGAWVDPGNGKSRFAVFLQLPLSSVFQEVSRSVADT